MHALRSGLAAALVLTLGTSAGIASAQPRPVSGKLDKSGYTVIALGVDGRASTAIARDGSFRLAPPALSVTLHLRAPDGTYAGPVVIAPDPRTVTFATRNLKRAKRLLVRAHRVLRKRHTRAARERVARGRKRVAKAKRLLRRARRERARRPTIAITGVKAGAELGRIEVKAGYAVARGLANRRGTKWIDASRSAQATGGVPIGVGNFGRVASMRTDGAAIGDRDRDGVPEPLDIDDDGDLILDNLDRSVAGTSARAAEAGCGPDNMYCPGVYSGQVLFMEQTVNANAGSTTDQIDLALQTHGHLVFPVQEGKIELDCGGDLAASPPRPGLRYCSPSGSGEAAADSVGAPPFPGTAGDAFDRDGDGFGVLDPALETMACGAPCTTQFFLQHGAVARRPGLDSAISQIGSGDAFVQHIATDGDVSRCPPPAGQVLATCVDRTLTVQYVVATVPTLVSYSDTAGHSATVPYPAPPFDPNCGSSCNARGKVGSGFPVAPGSDGDIWLRLTFWRPQRRAIPGSDPLGAEWMDLGHLRYGVLIGAGGPACRADSFSEDDPSTPGVVEDDANLVPASPVLNLNGGGGFDDQRADVPSRPGDTSPVTTFSYSLNLSRCLAEAGLTLSDERVLQFIGAPGPQAFATQNVAFRPPSGVTVKNVTEPAESPTAGTEFEFHPLGRPNFTLRHDGAKVFGDIPPGDYSVQELDAPGYELTSITCDDADSTGSVADRGATFKIAPGEHVTCTFTNKKL